MSYRPHADYRESGATFFQRQSQKAMAFNRLNPRNFASETAGAISHLPPSIQRNTHLFTSAITVILSAAIVGTSSHVLDVYNSQKATSVWWLPLWPQHFDTGAIPTTIGISATLLSLALLHLLLSFVPSISHQITKYNVLTLIITIPSVALSLSAFSYAAFLNNRAPSTETIQSWTCRWSETRASSSSDKQAQGVPNDFSSLCLQSQFAFYGLIVIFIFQAVSVTIALICVLEQSASRNNGQANTQAPSPQSDHKETLVGYSTSGTRTPAASAQGPQRRPGD